MYNHECQLFGVYKQSKAEFTSLCQLQKRRQIFEGNICIMDGMEEFLIMNTNSDICLKENSNEKEHATWTHGITVTLIELYGKYRNHVGTLDLKTIKKLWEVVATEINKQFNTNYSAAHCENRWRVQERNYKKFVDNNNSTGRGRKCYEYAEAMDNIFGKEKNIHPEILLSANTVSTITDGPSVEEREEKERNEPEKMSNNDKENEIKRKKKTEAVISKKKLTRTDTLKLLSEDKKIYYNEMLKIHQTKIDIQKQKLQALQDRNILIKERNTILLKYIEMEKHMPPV